MNEIIRVKNVSYNRYEELLMQKDTIKKEAFQYERAYIREFGDLILEIFQLKLECIKKKKIIEFYQAAVNHGETVEQKELQKYLQKELSPFQVQLDNMIKDNEAAKDTGVVSEVELIQIKKIYRKMVKQIHPDINPMVSKSEQLQELWQRIIIAYNCNDLKMMLETEVLVTKIIRQLGNNTIDIDIPDIDERISELEHEIQCIRETDPYMYKLLLENVENVTEKKNSLLDEKKSYEEYDKQLENTLKKLMVNGGTITWRIN